jgi:hypothetical protein
LATIALPAYYCRRHAIQRLPEEYSKERQRAARLRKHEKRTCTLPRTEMAAYHPPGIVAAHGGVWFCVYLSVRMENKHNRHHHQLPDHDRPCPYRRVMV